MSIYVDYEEFIYLKMKPKHQEIYEKAKLTPEHAQLLLSISSEEIREKLLLSIAKNKLDPIKSREMYHSILKQGNIKGNALPPEIYVNTIDNVIEKIMNKGIDITSFKNETPRYFECVIRIPKL